ncbi:MAG: PD-(D/E)XK nuclease family protein [Bryobacteraceae bacterium]|jgi:hypothetical protein
MADGVRKPRNGDQLQQGFALLLDAFESLSSPVEEVAPFNDFLMRFHDLAETTDHGKHTEISEGDLCRLVESFEALWRPYVEENAHQPPSINIWKVAALGLDEVRNCRVLKWLLDPNESHFQGTRFLRCFFAVMGETWPDEPEAPLVRREVTADADSRLDLVIEFRSVLVCIEVKIQAHEDTAQIKRYFETVGRPVGRQFVGRLLTAHGEPGELIMDGFKRLLWSDVANALKRFAHSCGSEDALAARSAFVSQLAMQYAEFITSYFQSSKGAQS